MSKNIAKLGVIIPSANTALEYEFHKMLKNQEISFHISRVKLTEDTREQIENLIYQIPEATSLLKDANVDIIAFGCTAGSFIKGPSYDREIIDLIEDIAGVPATTTSTSVINALKELNLSKISVASPYENWLNERLKFFFEAHGITVITIKGLGITRNISLIPQKRILELIDEIDVPESHGIFISCTDLRTIELLDLLEHKKFKPVISSNQATLWNMLKILNLKVKIQGYGRLFEIL